MWGGYLDLNRFPKKSILNLYLYQYYVIFAPPCMYILYTYIEIKYSLNGYIGYDSIGNPKDKHFSNVQVHYGIWIFVIFVKGTISMDSML